MTSDDYITILYLFAASSLVVVHFWMPWSQPSVQMSEVLDELAQEHEQAIFVKVSKWNTVAYVTFYVPIVKVVYDRKEKCCNSCGSIQGSTVKSR